MGKVISISRVWLGRLRRSSPVAHWALCYSRRAREYIKIASSVPAERQKQYWSWWFMENIENEQYFCKSHMVIKELQDHYMSNSLAPREKWQLRSGHWGKSLWILLWKYFNALRSIWQFRTLEHRLTANSWQCECPNLHPEGFNIRPGIDDLPKCHCTVWCHLDDNIEHLQPVLPNEELIIDAILKRLRFLWPLRRCRERGQQRSLLEWQLCITNFQEQHSTSCVSDSCSCIPEIFEIANGMTCWAYAFQNVLSYPCKET